MTTKRLFRSTDERMVAGVCGGLAEYFEVDPTVMRVAFVLLTLFDGIGMAIYILMWIIVPERATLKRADKEDKAATESKATAESVATDDQKGGQSRAFWGVVLILLGGVLLLQQLLPWRVDVDLLLPTILVAVGLVTVARSFES